MDLDRYTLMAENVDDLRFGKIDVYKNDSDDTEIIFTISLKAENELHFEALKNDTVNRLSVNNQNSIQMCFFEFFPESLVVLQAFEYPNSDILERLSELKQPKELFNLIKDILNALHRLQMRNKEFGNLRPEFIFFREKDSVYVLVDRMGENTDLFKSYRN